MTPVDDPARVRAFTEAIGALRWTAADYRTSLDALFKALSAFTHDEIQYYYARRVSSRRVSKACRLLAWLLATAGVLIPLVQPILGPDAPATLLWWGYVCFAAAGAVLVFDSLFAGTQAHHRYTAAQLEIERIYSAFAVRWQAGMIKLEENPVAAAAISVVELAEAFSDAFHAAMGSETAGWKKDVSDGLAQLKVKIDAGIHKPR